MSSAILFAAIVAIWATVLMPRWLRSRPAVPGSSEANGETDTPEETAPDTEAVLPDAPATEPAPAPEAQPWPKIRPRRDPAPARQQAHRATPVVRARRRMLLTLVLLTACAAGVAVAHLAAYWVVVPPVGTLTGFLILLREAARSDAARASHRTAAARAGARTAEPRYAAAPVAPPVAPAAPAYVAGPTATPAPAATYLPPTGDYETGPFAEIIDISARIGDQLYDQYADAAHRAVGD